MKQLISIFLSVLLLASSTGIAYAQHFCGDYEMLSEITLGEKHLSCGMVMEDTACSDEHSEDHNCCDNEYTSVDTDDNFAKASFDIQFSKTFVAAFASVFVLIHTVDYITHRTSYAEYHPPPLIKDVPVFYETFLI